MRQTFIILATSLVLMVSGCGGEGPDSASPPAAGGQATADTPPTTEETAIAMTHLPPIGIGNFTVQAMYEGDLADGHFNLTIEGGEIAAVREWVGPEDASGVVVVKTEIENDYHHGHVEMPSPLPADARLWVEIETPDGQRLKGSTPLKG